MDNHVHILLLCNSIKEMSKFMQNVNTRFALYYNDVNERVGYVFRDRFLSEPIKNKEHLFSCISYIHYNPVVAGISKDFMRASIGLENIEDIIEDIDNALEISKK